MPFQMLYPYTKNKVLLYKKQALIDGGFTSDNQAMVDEKNRSNLELAAKISAAIKNSPLTAREIAQRCGVQPQSITGWKKTGRISKETLSVFADVVGVPLDHFIPKAKGQGATLSSVPAPPRDNSIDEVVELVSLFASASPDVRRRILDLARLLINGIDARRASDKSESGPG